MSDMIDAVLAGKQRGNKILNALVDEHNNYDKWTTPKFAVEAILPFLKMPSYILCPFDFESSAFSRVLEKAGHSVDFSHIDTGKDFFDYRKKTVERYDYIISHPPFSQKNRVLAHLFKLEKPFAMLMSLAGLFEAERFYLFKEHNPEFLILYPRVSYIHPQAAKSSALFQSCYVCQNVLPKMVMYVETSKISKKRKGKSPLELELEEEV